MLDLKPCIRPTKMKSNIISVFETIIPSAKTITYRDPSFDMAKGEYILDAQTIVEIAETDKKEKNVLKAFVYLLLDDAGNCLYVGSSRDIKSRLDSHLIKNNRFKKDGSLKASFTGSEIDMVYFFVKTTKSIKYCYTRIEPWYMYTAVENLLIDHFRKKNRKAKVAQIWNAGFQDDDVQNDTPPLLTRNV